mmetsp:Transcript_38830/g.97577  ORF Transcript_38830/g.97577 Transcript_38830/m.97577 type:complete len:234 (-) Transcript_38830:212-913(-)
MSSNKLSMQPWIVPKRAVSNSSCALSFRAVCSTKRTIKIAHTYNMKAISKVTQNTAWAASAKPYASKYNWRRNLTMRKMRKMRSSRMTRKTVATPVDDPSGDTNKRMEQSTMPKKTTMTSKMFQTASAPMMNSPPRTYDRRSSSLVKKTRNRSSTQSQCSNCFTSVSMPITTAFARIIRATVAWKVAVWNISTTTFGGGSSSSSSSLSHPKLGPGSFEGTGRYSQSQVEHRNC